MMARRIFATASALVVLLAVAVSFRVCFKMHDRLSRCFPATSGELRVLWNLRDYRFETQRLKIAWVSLQISCAIPSTTDVVWPSPFHQFSNFFAKLTEFKWVSTECAFDNYTFEHSLIGATLVPLAVVALAWMGAAAAPLWVKRGRALPPSASVAPLSNLGHGHTARSASAKVQHHTPSPLGVGNSARRATEFAVKKRATQINGQLAVPTYQQRRRQRGLMARRRAVHFTALVAFAVLPSTSSLLFKVTTRFAHFYAFICSTLPDQLVASSMITRP